MFIKFVSFCTVYCNENVAQFIVILLQAEMLTSLKLATCMRGVVQLLQVKAIFLDDTEGIYIILLSDPN